MHACVRSERERERKSARKEKVRAWRGKNNTVHKVGKMWQDIKKEIALQKQKNRGRERAHARERNTHTHTHTGRQKEQQRYKMAEKKTNVYSSVIVAV